MIPGLAVSVHLGGHFGKLTENSIFYIYILNSRKEVYVMEKVQTLKEIMSEHEGSTAETIKALKESFTKKSARENKSSPTQLRLFVEDSSFILTSGEKVQD